LPDLVRHYGEPFGDSSAIPTYYVSRLARRQVPMVLTGDGGDELFLGYPRYAHWANRGAPLPTRPWWKQKLRPAFQFVAPRRFPPDPKPRPPGLQDWMKEIILIDRPMRFGLWRPEFSQMVDDHVEEIEQVGVDALSAPLQQFGQYVDIVTYLPHDILTKVDVATMMHGLEARTPLADVRMAEFAATVPCQINLGQKADTGHWSGKQLLKRFLGKYFDHEFLHRQKAGFTLPLKHWFAEHGPLWPELNDRLLASSARIHRYFRPEALKQIMIGQALAPTHLASQQIWQLLFLENWLEHVHDAGRNKKVDSVQLHRLPHRERLC
jgi:asparagine synthase (glutamine-hydrolysing)